MARRTPFLALALVVSGLAGLAGCGDDAGSTAATTTTTTTTTTAPTTTAVADPAAKVDELCAKSDEVQATLAEVTGGDPEAQLTPEQQEQVSAAVSELAQLAIDLQGSVARMLPGDVARYQQCSAVIGGPGALPQTGGA